MIQSYLANVHNLIESWALEMLNRGQIDFNKMFTDPMVKKKTTDRMCYFIHRHDASRRCHKLSGIKILIGILYWQMQRNDTTYYKTMRIMCYVNTSI